MRKVVLIASGITLLALLYVALQLFVAHLGIRRVNPPIPSAAGLRSNLGTPGGPIRFRYLNTASQSGTGTARMGFPAFRFEWANGRSFLIDVGMDREGALEFGRLIELLVGADAIEPQGSIGELLGDEAPDVHGVAFTHLHEDHTSGIDTLCEAAGHSVALYQTPIQSEKGNYTTAPGREDIDAAACLEPRAMQPLGDSIYAIPGFPGLLAVAAGGHTPGSTIFVAKLDGVIRVLSGDITNFKDSITHDRPKPWAYSTFITPESTERLARLRQWLAELDARPEFEVVVSHDLDALEAAGINP